MNESSDKPNSSGNSSAELELKRLQDRVNELELGLANSNKKQLEFVSDIVKDQIWMIKRVHSDRMAILNLIKAMSTLTVGTEVLPHEKTKKLTTYIMQAIESYEQGYEEEDESKD